MGSAASTSSRLVVPKFVLVDYIYSTVSFYSSSHPHAAPPPGKQARN